METPQPRSVAILAAIREQVELRRLLLDHADDLGAITVTIKLQAGTAWVRGVIWEEERVCRTRP